MTDITPRNFWLQCELEVDSKIDPTTSLRTALINALRELGSEISKFDSLLPTQPVKDLHGLQTLSRAFDQYRTRIIEMKSALVAAAKRQDIPEARIAGEDDLRQMIEQVHERLVSVLVLISKRMNDEATRWLQESGRIKSEIETEQQRLAQEAETLLARVKSVSDKILADAAQVIKQTEKEFVVDQDRVCEVSKKPTPNALIVNQVVAGIGVLGLLAGLFLIQSSLALGGSLAIVGAVAIMVGIFKIRKSPTTIPTVELPTNKDGSSLRIKLRQITEAAEQTVSASVAGVKSELKLVREALEGLPAKDKQQQIQCRETSLAMLANLQTSEIDRAGKMKAALQDVCRQWEKLVQQANDRLLSDWKQKISNQATAMSSPGGREANDDKIRSRISLGAAQYAAPPKVKRLVGNVVISAPFWFDFADGGICVQVDPTTTTQDSGSAVCTKCVLELAIASQGRLALRLWDPRMMGASYSDLLTLAQWKDGFVESGRALTTNRELEDTLSALQKKTADRMALLAKAPVGSWSEAMGLANIPDSNFEVLLVVGFPSGFSESAITTLQAIATAGPRCGIFVLIEVLPGAEMDAIREKIRIDANKLAVGLQQINIANNGMASSGGQDVKISFLDARLLDHARSTLQTANGLLEPIAQTQQQSEPAGDITFEAYREMVAPNSGWQESSQGGLVVRLGTGLNDHEPQLMRFDNTTPHALLLGGTGSGKSNLLHSVIQGLAMDYSPLELSLYLADLKDGVEFSHYTQEGRLPHAAAIAATADPRYAVALVKAAAEELTRRNKLFIGAECANFEKYRSIEYCTLPRILLVIDEFQVLFEDRESATAVKSALINLCKKGRSAGIHLLLASQSLKGKAGDIDEVLGLIQIRILMKISEADGRRAVSNAEMASRAATKCNRRGIGCIDFDFGSGDERYFRNPHVDNNNYFFNSVRRFIAADGSSAYLDEEPVVWKDEPRILESNPQFKRLERSSRKILIGEPYSLDHAVGFSFSPSHVGCVALSTSAPKQQLSVLTSIFKSAAQTCNSSIKATFVRNSDSVLDDLAIQSLASAAGSSTIVEGSQVGQALTQLRTELQDGVDRNDFSFHVLCILGNADLSVPKRSSFSSVSPDQTATLSDIELIASLLSSDFQGRLQIIIACRSPATFIDQFALFKDRISVRIFGSVAAGGRLRDFVGLTDLVELKPEDMGLIISNDSTVSIFKPFGIHLGGQ